MERMRAAGGGIAVLATAPEAIRNRDAEYPYRHDSDFFYLTGFTEPEAWLVLIAGATDRALLFCRPRHVEHEIWEGKRFGPEAAAERFGFDDAHPIDALDELMPTLLMDQPTLYAPLAGNRRADGRLRRWLAAARESDAAAACRPNGSRTWPHSGGDAADQGRHGDRRHAPRRQDLRRRSRPRHAGRPRRHARVRAGSRAVV